MNEFVSTTKDSSSLQKDSISIVGQSSHMDKVLDSLSRAANIYNELVVSIGFQVRKIGPFDEESKKVLDYSDLFGDKTSKEVSIIESLWDIENFLSRTNTELEIINKHLNILI